MENDDDDDDDCDYAPLNEAQRRLNYNIGLTNTQMLRRNYKALDLSLVRIKMHPVGLRLFVRPSVCLSAPTINSKTEKSTTFKLTRLSTSEMTGRSLASKSTQCREAMNRFVFMK